MPTNILSDLAAEFIFSAEVNLAEIYSGLTESFRDQNEQWLKWAKCESPHTTALPGDWEQKLSSF